MDRQIITLNPEFSILPITIPQKRRRPIAHEREHILRQRIECLYSCMYVNFLVLLRGVRHVTLLPKNMIET